MITVHQFASGFNSIWKNLTPNCDRLIRKLNLSVDRFEEPIINRVVPERRGLINEIAFEIVKKNLDKNWPNYTTRSEDIPESIVREVSRRVGKLKGAHTVEIDELDQNEIQEVFQLAFSLEKFVIQLIRAKPEFEPVFPGCGILFGSEGDFIIEKTLFEVKSGDRTFRSIDLRQLLIYAALDFNTQESNINNIGLVNPRNGTYFIQSLDTICFEIGGITKTELFTQLIYHLSSGDISR